MGWLVWAPQHNWHNQIRASHFSLWYATVLRSSKKIDNWISFNWIYTLISCLIGTIQSLVITIVQLKFMAVCIGFDCKQWMHILFNTDSNECWNFRKQFTTIHSCWHRTVECFYFNFSHWNLHYLNNLFIECPIEAATKCCSLTTFDAGAHLIS